MSAPSTSSLSVIAVTVTSYRRKIRLLYLYLYGTVLGEEPSMHETKIEAKYPIITPTTTSLKCNVRMASTYKTS